MGWEVEFTDPVRGLVDRSLPLRSGQDHRAVNVLAAEGPKLKRPLVGKIEAATRHKHLKELIPPASSIRILFAFDPRSAAILLLGGDGDKRGDWSGG